MSQAKVDRYKKEKKNRSRDLKLQKVKKALIVFILALAFGVLI